MHDVWAVDLCRILTVILVWDVVHGPAVRGHSTFDMNKEIKL